MAQANAMLTRAKAYVEPVKTIIPGDSERAHGFLVRHVEAPFMWLPELPQPIIHGTAACITEHSGRGTYVLKSILVAALTLKFNHRPRHAVYAGGGTNIKNILANFRRGMIEYDDPTKVIASNERNVKSRHAAMPTKNNEFSVTKQMQSAKLPQKAPVFKIMEILSKNLCK